MKNKGLILFLTYGDDKYPEARDFLFPILEHCDQFDFSVLRIDNKENLPWEKIESGYSNIDLYNCPGDNSHYEMSGWDKGFSISKEKLGEDFSFVLIVNDALLNSKPIKDLESISNNLIEKVIKKNVVVGYIDTFSRVSPEAINTLTNPMKIYNRALRWYVCTTFILTNYSVWDKSYPMVSEVNPHDIYLEQYEANKFFKEDAPLSQQYQQFLVNHQTRKWYKKYDINKESYEKFKMKTECIIREQFFSIKLREQTFRFLDVSVLAKHIGCLHSSQLSLSLNILILKTKIKAFREQWQGMIK
jgi:hypothetical protein